MAGRISQSWETCNRIISGRGGGASERTMANVIILVWKNRDGTGEPEAEVRIPTNLAKWLPRMMMFVPKKTKEETWGQDIDFGAMAADIDKMVQEALASGPTEPMTVRTKDSFVKISVEK